MSLACSSLQPSQLPSTPTNNLTRAAPGFHATDELGELVVECANRLQAADGDWENFIRDVQHPSDFASNVGKLPHPAAQLLDRLHRSGAPVPVKTAPWTRARKREALRRGPHKSAVEHSAFLREEMAAMIRKGQ